MGMQKGTATWEDSLTVPYKAEHELTISSAITFPGIYPTDLKTCPWGDYQRESGLGGERGG